MKARRDNGVVSALVVCLVLPSMASMWWRHFLDPSLHAAADRPSPYTQVEVKLDPEVPGDPSWKKPSDRRHVVQNASLILQPRTPEAYDAMIRQGAVQDERSSTDWFDSLTFSQDDADDEVGQGSGAPHSD